MKFSKLGTAMYAGCLAVSMLDAQITGSVGITPPVTDVTGNSQIGTLCTPGNITYHNGPIMSGVVRIYPIFYGQNWTPGDRQIILDLIGNLGGSGYWNINSTYTQTSPSASVSNALSSGPKIIYDTTDSVGTDFNGTVMQNYLTSLFNAKKLPVDTNGIYVFLTSQEVGASADQYCSGGANDFCAYHTYYTYGGKQIKYAFQPNPLHCASPYTTSGRTSGVAGCVSISANYNQSPNNSPAIDAMASSFTHELMETVSDPLINAWFDGCSNENGDKCAYNYGTTAQVGGANLSNYNITLGSRKFLIQQNWSNVSQSCKITYP